MRTEKVDTNKEDDNKKEENTVVNKPNSDNENKKEGSQDFQGNQPEKDPDLKSLIADLAKTVQDLVKDNQLRKQQEALWMNQLQPYQPYQQYQINSQ